MLLVAKEEWILTTVFIVGVIICTGFIFGEIATKFKLPKVTGYILAGVLLDPQLTHFIPKDFVSHTTPVTNIALALIAFSIGGSLYLKKIRKLGKGILYITPLEAEFALIAVIVGFLVCVPIFMKAEVANVGFATLLALSLLIASLASATDPSATFAVAKEYKAQGDVISTVLGVAALDDVMGIMNFSFAVVISQALLAHKGFGIASSILAPLLNIIGAMLLGVVFGFLFNFITWLVRKESEGVFIVLIVGMLALCFGCADIISVDQLLATMTMGAIVVNFNKKQEKIFQMLERYTDELVFVLFFTLCGMQLNFQILSKAIVLILLFGVFRLAGKWAGTVLGATLAKSSRKVKIYTTGGLVPQGGIIVGLALMLKQNPAFGDKIADIVISIIIGSTVIHEMIGPIIAKIALRKAGEIK